MFVDGGCLKPLGVYVAGRGCVPRREGRFPLWRCRARQGPQGAAVCQTDGSVKICMLLLEAWAWVYMYSSKRAAEGEKLGPPKEAPMCGTPIQTHSFIQYMFNPQVCACVCECSVPVDCIEGRKRGKEPEAQDTGFLRHGGLEAAHSPLQKTCMVRIKGVREGEAQGTSAPVVSDRRAEMQSWQPC